MENLFENAYFGKPYKTRGDKKAVLIQPKTYHVILEDLTEYSVMKDGLAYDDMATSYDIVSEWHEEINEEELDTTAIDKAVIYSDTYEERTGNYGMDKCSLAYGYRDGYYDGYMEGSSKAQES